MSHCTPQNTNKNSNLNPNISYDISSARYTYHMRELFRKPFDTVYLIMDKKAVYVDLGPYFDELENCRLIFP